MKEDGGGLVACLKRLYSNQRAAWCAVGLWMLVIFAFSAQPHSGEITEQYLGDFNIGVRKCAHMFEYFLLFLLLRHAMRLTWTRVAGFVPFALTVLYAMSDEFHQVFVPGRSATVSDVFVDATGAAIGWLLVTLLPRLTRRAAASSKS